MPATRVWSGNQQLRRLLVPIDSLAPHPKNPRRHNLGVIRDSLRRFGQQRPVLVVAPGRIDPERATLVAGHGTASAALEEGWTHIAAVQSDLTDDEIAAYLLADNRTSDLGTYEEQDLADLLRVYHEQDALVGTGYGPDDYERLRTRVAWNTEAADLPAPEPPPDPKSEHGVLYELGPHRLLCGDATDSRAVAQLLGDEQPMLLLTDPPYGVDLEMSWRDRAGRNRAFKDGPRTDGHTNTSMTGDDRVDWSEAFALVPSLKIAYVWYASAHGCEVQAGLERIGFRVHQMIVWNKGRFALSRAHYHWQHETCLYASKYEPCFYARKPGSRKWGGTLDQPTVWDAASPKMRGSADEAKLDHPTQKPALLYARPIENHLLLGESFYEPFAGSGTAFAAAEVTGRVCLGMELDPRYVDVIRQRYADLTGQPHLAP